MCWEFCTPPIRGVRNSVPLPLEVSGILYPSLGILYPLGPPNNDSPLYINTYTKRRRWTAQISSPFAWRCRRCGTRQSCCLESFFGPLPWDAHHVCRRKPWLLYTETQSYWQLHAYSTSKASMPKRTREPRNISAPSVKLWTAQVLLHLDPLPEPKYQALPLT